MLKMFANHIALAQEAFGVGAKSWDDAFEPERLAEILVCSFLEDIRLALEQSTYTYPPVDIHGVGTLQRREGGRIHFTPHDLFYHEGAMRESLLDGQFWKIICQVDSLEEMFFVPPRSAEPRIYSTARLREVGEHMIKVIQQRKRPDKFLRDIVLETFRNGLCLGIHDAICEGEGFHLEGIGTIFRNGHFEIDRLFRKKIQASYQESREDTRCHLFIDPASRRRTYNQAWYRLETSHQSVF